MKERYPICKKIDKNSTAAKIQTHEEKDVTFQICVLFMTMMMYHPSATMPCLKESVPFHQLLHGHDVQCYTFF